MEHLCEYFRPKKRIQDAMTKARNYDDDPNSVLYTQIQCKKRKRKAHQRNKGKK